MYVIAQWQFCWLSQLQKLYKIWILCKLRMFHILYISHGCLTLTLCMLGNFSCFCRLLLFFFKINIFKKFFQIHYPCVKQFGSRSGRTFCRSWSGSKLFAKVIGTFDLLLSTGSTQKARKLSWHTWKIVGWDIKHQNKQKSYQQTTKVITSKERVGIYH